MTETVPERVPRARSLRGPEAVVAEFEELGLLEKVENHRHAVGHCYRCDTSWSRGCRTSGS